MIFVSVGTHDAPFDRMLRAIYELGLDEELVVQHGPSKVRGGHVSVQADFFPFDEMVEYVQRARAIVTHAGVGSVMISLANGKRPIVMARRQELGEHVDDHQLELAERMQASGLATFVDSQAALARALAEPAQAVELLRGVPWLGDELGGYLAGELGVPRALVTPAP